MSLATALLLFALLGNGLGVLVNRTIDDQFGDPIARITPTYAPIALWTQGAICQLCGAKPDIHQVFNHTWHDSTYTVQDGQTRNITIPFNGSAIYIFFFTVPKTVYISETHLNITLDGHPAGAFDFVPNSSDNYQYNVSVYSNSKLVSGQHIIMLSTGGNADAVLEFDYAIYSTDDGKQSRLGAIVGGIVGAIVAIFIFILLWFWRRRRRRGRARDEDNPPVVDVNEDKKNILRGQLEELSNIQRNSQPGLAG